MEVSGSDIVAASAAIFAALASVFTFTVKAWISARGSEATSERLTVLTERLSEDVKKLVKAEEDFQRKGWGTLPNDLSSSSGLTSTIRGLQRDVEYVRGVQNDVLIDLANIQEALKEIGKHDG